MNKRGFSVLNAIIILIVVAIIGYFLYTKFLKKPVMTEEVNTPQGEVAAPPAPAEHVDANPAPAPSEGNAGAVQTPPADQAGEGADETE